MAKFRDIGTLQKWVAIDTSAPNIHNHGHHLPPAIFSNKTAPLVWPNGDISRLENSIVHTFLRPL